MFIDGRDFVVDGHRYKTVEEIPDLGSLVGVAKGENGGRCCARGNGPLRVRRRGGRAYAGGQPVLVAGRRPARGADLPGGGRGPGYPFVPLHLP